MSFSRATAQTPNDVTTNIEGLREIALYYTVDDGHSVTLRKGVLHANHQSGRFGVRFRGRHYVLHLKELALSDSIGDLKRGKDIYVYIRDENGIDGNVVLFTLFGNKEVADHWMTERQREYHIARKILR